MTTSPDSAPFADAIDRPDGEMVDVAIVGAGPVGLTLAILLGQLGRRVVVYERWATPYPLPRAVHLDHEAARILQNAGLGDDLGEITEPASVYEWSNADGVTLLRIGRRGVSPSGWPESVMFNQPELEARIARRAASLDAVTIVRGVEVVGLVEGDDGVALTLTSSADGGSPRTVGARFVVGCDGANSTVARLAGLPMHDLGFFFDWLIVDVVLDEPRVFDPINVQVCDPRRPTTAVSGGPGRRRWEFMRLPGEAVDALNTEARAWELLAPWDVHPGNARLERHAVYTFQARYAERWGTSRTFVAGDAAHLMPPFAGQGLCAGLRDVANLSWKLDLVLAGKAGPGLLGTYEAERLPNARAAIEFSMALGKVICVPDPDEAAARDAAMAAGVTDEPSEAPSLPALAVGCIDPSDAHAGQPFPQGLFDGVLLESARGPGWKLLTACEVSPDAELAAWFAAIGGQIVRVDGVDPCYADWFAGHGVVAALQRPDFHLYGTSPDPLGADGLLGRLRAHLSEGDPR